MRLPKVGDVIIDQYGDEHIVVSVRKSLDDFMIHGEWYPFSYMYLFTYKDEIPV